MNYDMKNSTELFNAIYQALSDLDPKGYDKQITRSMAIVYEAFSLYAKGDAITSHGLVQKANEVVNECEHS